MAAAGKPDPATPPQPPSAAKGVFMRRIFPFLLATNVFIGGERGNPAPTDLPPFHSCVLDGLTMVRSIPFWAASSVSYGFLALPCVDYARERLQTIDLQ